MRRAVRAARTWRGLLAMLAVVAIGVLIARTAAPATRMPVELARRALQSIVEDVRGATAYRYSVDDDQGRSMDTADVIWIPEAGTFAAVYHSMSQADGLFEVHLATSDDLLTWTWRTRLAVRASQATIEPASDGGYVMAWEQSPDPLHIVLTLFRRWADLLDATPSRRIAVPVTTPGCGEGTPSIEAASSRRVSVAFHYHAGCTRDRQAVGATDWKGWRASTRPLLDSALMRAGARGHIGDRDAIEFQGNRLMLIEGQLAADDPASWRTFLYDPETRSAEPLRIRTHGGTPNAANPTVSRIVIDGRSAVLVTVFLFTEGAGPGEPGELIYYRVDEA
jgi:hypothetical protein